MHCARFAPELSATVTIVRSRIMAVPPCTPYLSAAARGRGIAATPPALAEDRTSGASRGESGARQEAARSVRRGDAPPSRRRPRRAPTRRPSLCALHHLDEPPTLVFGERPGLHEADAVADVTRVLLVVHLELRAP